LLGFVLSAATAAGTAAAHPIFASKPEPVAGRMTLGAAAPAPLGFVEFCRRQPGDCDQATPAADPTLVSASSPTASITTADPSQDATSTLIAPWLANLDIKAITAPTGRKSRLELIDWSKSDRTGDGATPLNQMSLAVRLERAFRALRNLPPEDQAPEAAAVAAAEQDKAATIQLTPKTWAQINKINLKINKAIAQRTDLEIYGRDEVWATPLEEGQRFGDCEDFVLEKRRALIAEGFPPKALSIAVVLTPRNERHAVLLVNGEAGEYVLDNMNSWVTPWDRTEYRWRERQVAGSANHWAGVQPAPSNKSDPDYYKQVLLASLH